MSYNNKKYKIEEAHIRLGSKIHIKDFYYASKLFQDSYYALRFAYLIANHIVSKCDKEIKNIIEINKDKNESKNKEKKLISIIGYALYSELLVSNIADLLNEFYQEDIFTHVIIDDIVKMNIIPLENLKQYVIIIIPIGSTLTTPYKIYKRLKREEERFKKEGKEIQVIIEPICPIIVGHQELNNIIDKNGNVTYKIVKKYWKSVDINERIIELVYAVDEIKKVRYFIYIPSEWFEPFNCPYCWNWKNIKPLFYTDKTSTAPLTFEGSIKIKEISYKTIDEKISDKFKGCLKYGHYIRGQNHYNFYIDSNKFFEKNKQNIESWLTNIRNKYNFDKPAIIISPVHETNISFVNMVNEVIFNGLAGVRYIDIEKDDLSSLFNIGNAKNKDFSMEIYFVDDAICTGNTLLKTLNKLKLIDPYAKISGCFVMFNRANYEDFKIVSSNINEIFSFINIEAPVLKGKDACYLCRERDKYEKLLEITLIDALKLDIVDKITKLTPSKIPDFNIEENKPTNKKNDESIDNIRKEKRHFIRFLISHYLFKYLNQEEQVLLNPLMKKIKRIIKQQLSANDEEIDINILKVLSQHPFVYYRHIRESIYPKMYEKLCKYIEELKELKHKDFDIEHYFKLIYIEILLRRLAYMGCPLIIKKEFIVSILELINKLPSSKNKNLKIFNTLGNIKNELNKMPKSHELFSNSGRDIVDEFLDRINLSVNEIDSNWEKAYEKLKLYIEYKLKKQIQEKLDRFHIIFALAIKEIISSEEGKSLRFEYELSKIRNELDKKGDLTTTKTIDFLNLLYIENNLIIHNALQVFNSAETNHDVIKSKIIDDYRLAPLRILIKLKNNPSLSLEDLDDILTEEEFESEYFKNIIFLIETYNYLKYISNQEIPSQLPNIIDNILTYILRPVNNEEHQVGTFLAVREPVFSSEIEKLNIVGMKGNIHLYSDKLGATSWSLLVCNGLKTFEDGYEWTNIYIDSLDDTHKFINAKFSFSESIEYKFIGDKKYFFIRICDIKKELNKKENPVIPKGVLAIVKNEPITLDVQRNLLHLRDILNLYIKTHYENIAFYEWMWNKQLKHAFGHLRHWFGKHILPKIENREKVDEELKRIANYWEILAEKKVNKKAINLYREITEIIKRYSQYTIKFNEYFNETLKIKIDDNLDSLSIIIDNIISNSFERGKASLLEIKLKKDANYIKMIFSDNGKGIEDITTMITPYAKCNESDGLGLGLSIVYDLINICNWDIDIQSNIRQGTIVTIKIPYTIEEVILNE